MKNTEINADRLKDVNDEIIQVRVYHFRDEKPWKPVINVVYRLNVEQVLIVKRVTYVQKEVNDTIDEIHCVVYYVLVDRVEEEEVEGYSSISTKLGVFQGVDEVVTV